MARLLLLAALGLFVVMSLRRALQAGRRGPRPRPGPARRSSTRPPRGGAQRSDRAPRDRDGELRDPALPPDRLVCGACGHGFDPELSGWICPHCGK